jgi:hypothetical protein
LTLERDERILNLTHELECRLPSKPYRLSVEAQVQIRWAPRAPAELHASPSCRSVRRLGPWLGVDHRVPLEAVAERRIRGIAIARR